jgi:hypothetical protein
MARVCQATKSDIAVYVTRSRQTFAIMARLTLTSLRKNTPRVYSPCSEKPEDFFCKHAR